MPQIDKLKIQLGINHSQKDSVLNLLLEDVESDLLSWTNRNKLPKALESIQRQLAVIRYNMQGIEGQTSHSEGGVSRSFDELPQSIRNTIAQYRLAKVVRYGSS